MFKSLASTNFATWAGNFIYCLLHPFAPDSGRFTTTVYHNATWAGDIFATLLHPFASDSGRFATTVYHNATWAK